VTAVARTSSRAAADGRRVGLKALDGLSVVLAAVMTAASLVGLLLEDLYRENTWSRAAFRGTDAATLALAVPTLLVALVLARRGSVGARLVWLGVLAYDVYDYAFYLFGAVRRRVQRRLPALRRRPGPCSGAAGLRRPAPSAS
jgi:hypothetical protein